GEVKGELEEGEVKEEVEDIHGEIQLRRKKAEIRVDRNFGEVRGVLDDNLQRRLEEIDQATKKDITALKRKLTSDIKKRQLAALKEKQITEERSEELELLCNKSCASILQINWAANRNTSRVLEVMGFKPRTKKRKAQRKRQNQRKAQKTAL